MKKILATMLMLCLILSAVAINASARETTTTLDVPKATTAPVIDGDIDDCWKFAPEVDVVNFGSNIYPQTSTAKADAKNPVAKAKGRLLWDETHLYAIIRVFDPTPNGQPAKENPEDCDYDSIDFQISELNLDNQPLRDDTVGSDNKFPGNGIFNVNINGKVTGWGGVWYADHGDEKVKGAAKTTDYGYIAEIAIPIQTTTFSEGDQPGFEFQINDNQKGEGRSAIRLWAATQCLAHSGTKYLGTLNLVAASKIEYPYGIFTTAAQTTARQTTKPAETTPKSTTKAVTTTAAETTRAIETTAAETDAPDTTVADVQTTVADITSAETTEQATTTGEVTTINDETQKSESTESPLDIAMKVVVIVAGVVISCSAVAAVIIFAKKVKK